MADPLRSISGYHCLALAQGKDLQEEFKDHPRVAALWEVWSIPILIYERIKSVLRKQ